jgi:hypothetical protein
MFKVTLLNFQGKSQSITASFSPTVASSVNALAVCSVNGNLKLYHMTLVGIAGFAFLSLLAPAPTHQQQLSVIGALPEKTDCASLVFGSIVVGRSGEKTIMLRNLSQVRSSFKVGRLYAFIVYAGIF